MHDVFGVVHCMALQCARADMNEVPELHANMPTMGLVKRDKDE